MKKLCKEKLINLLEGTICDIKNSDSEGFEYDISINKIEKIKIRE